MKTMKNIYLYCTLFLVITLLTITSHAGVRTSPTGYIGSASYWATASFNDSTNLYLTGTAQMHVNGGMITNQSVDDYRTYVIVKAKLSAPNNYGVDISRTIN